MLDSVRFDSVPMLTTKKNRAMKIGGITASRSRGTARRARPAMAVMSDVRPAGLARTAGEATTVVRLAVVMS